MKSPNGTGAVIAVAALTALAGCSSSSGSEDNAPEMDALGPSVTVPSNDSAAPGLGDEALRPLLLTAAELPVGFVPLPDPEQDLGLPPADDTSETDKSATDPRECAAVLAPVAQQSAGAVGSASSMFSGPNFSSFDQDIASYGDNEATARAFETVQDTLSRCGEYTGTDVDGIDITYRLGARDQEPVGDASVAFRLVTSSEGLTLTSDVVIAVVGNNIVQMAAAGQTEIDPGVFADTTKKAVEKVAVRPAS
ncbi:sensor domain-containing protein [Rhodococcus sp. NPDC058521]|uniref:sensor domain-containing protein n=1 Tax=Rhodococcus sp. NPDC058521 TaxID=3346536 RepID=UPI0036474816